MNHVTWASIFLIIMFSTQCKCNIIDHVFTVLESNRLQYIPQLVFNSVHRYVCIMDCVVTSAVCHFFSTLSKLSLLEGSSMLRVSCLVLRSEADAHKGHSEAWPGTPSEALWKLIPWLKTQPYLLFPNKCS